MRDSAHQVLTSILSNVNEFFCNAEHKYCTLSESGNKLSPTVLPTYALPMIS